MSRPISYTSAVTFIPSSYVSAGTYTFTHGAITNAYTDADSTTYNQMTLAKNRNNTRQSQMYYIFDTSAVSDIPSNATIDSVTANVKYYISSTNYVTAVSIRLYAGTTAKGTAITTRPTSATKYAITAGNWSLSELENARLYVSATHSASNTNAYLYFYGADLTVNYSVNGTEYEVTINNSTTVTTEPIGTTYIFEGGEQEVKLNTTDISNITITDNGNTVNFTPEYEPITASTTLVPNNYSAQSQSYTISGNNGYNSTANTTNYVRLRSSSTNQYYTYYFFNTSIIPDECEITSISCQIRGRAENGTGETYIGYAQLMGETSPKGAEVVISSQTESAVISLISGTNWTSSDAKNIKLRLRHPFGGSNRYVDFYGASLTINYSMPGTGGTIIYYTYTISNISTDHVISISEKSSSTGISIKDVTWKNVTAVYKKVNGSWGSPLSNPKEAFTDSVYKKPDGTLYIKKNQ